MNRKRIANSKYIEFYYCICKGSYMGTNTSSITCKICKKQSHRICVHYKGLDKDFECMLCKVQLLDPFNTVEDFLWYDSLGNTTKTFSIDATNIKKWRSQNKDIYMASIPFNKDKLQHEWPKSMELKINNDIIHVVKEPTWEHKRRDNPIKITYAMRPGKNAIEILSSTYNETEPLFLVIMFLSKQVTIDRIFDTVKKKHTISYDESLARISTIINRNIDDDDIVCMENTHKIDLNCPVTMDRIVIPARGRYCEHIQCYDLDGYLRVMEKTSAFNMRWRCPECQLTVKPYDLVVDGFVQRIIQNVPQSVSRVELDKNANYRIFSNEATFDTKHTGDSSDTSLKPVPKANDTNSTTTSPEPFSKSNKLTPADGESKLDDDPKDTKMDSHTNDFIVLDSDEDTTNWITKGTTNHEVIYISDHDSSNTEDSTANIAPENLFNNKFQGVEYNEIELGSRDSLLENKDSYPPCQYYTLTPISYNVDHLNTAKREYKDAKGFTETTTGNTDKISRGTTHDSSKRAKHKASQYRGKSTCSSTLTASTLISEGNPSGSVNANLIPYSITRDSCK